MSTYFKIFQVLRINEYHKVKLSKSVKPDMLDYHVQTGKAFFLINSSKGDSPSGYLTSVI
jgi:hypothetical protein